MIGFIEETVLTESANQLTEYRNENHQPESYQMNNAKASSQDAIAYFSECAIQIESPEMIATNYVQESTSTTCEFQAGQENLQMIQLQYLDDQIVISSEAAYELLVDGQQLQTYQVNTVDSSEQESNPVQILQICPVGTQSDSSSEQTLESLEYQNDSAELSNFENQCFELNSSDIRALDSSALDVNIREISDIQQQSSCGDNAARNDSFRSGNVSSSEAMSLTELHFDVDYTSQTSNENGLAENQNVFLNSSAPYVTLSANAEQLTASINASHKQKISNESSLSSYEMSSNLVTTYCDIRSDLHMTNCSDGRKSNNDSLPFGMDFDSYFGESQAANCNPMPIENIVLDANGGEIQSDQNAESFGVDYTALLSDSNGTNILVDQQGNPTFGIDLDSLLSQPRDNSAIIDQTTTTQYGNDLSTYLVNADGSAIQGDQGKGWSFDVDFESLFLGTQSHYTAEDPSSGQALEKQAGPDNMEETDQPTEEQSFSTLDIYQIQNLADGGSISYVAVDPTWQINADGEIPTYAAISLPCYMAPPETVQPPKPNNVGFIDAFQNFLQNGPETEDCLTGDDRRSGKARRERTINIKKNGIATTCDLESLIPMSTVSVSSASEKNCSGAWDVSDEVSADAESGSASLPGCASYCTHCGEVTKKFNPSQPMDNSAENFSSNHDGNNFNNTELLTNDTANGEIQQHSSEIANNPSNVIQFSSSQASKEIPENHPLLSHDKHCNSDSRDAGNVNDTRSLISSESCNIQQSVQCQTPEWVKYLSYADKGQFITDRQGIGIQGDMNRHKKPGDVSFMQKYSPKKTDKCEAVPKCRGRKRKVPESDCTEENWDKLFDMQKHQEAGKENHLRYWCSKKASI